MINMNVLIFSAKPYIDKWVSGVEMEEATEVVEEEATEEVVVEEVEEVSEEEVGASGAGVEEVVLEGEEGTEEVRTY